MRLLVDVGLYLLANKLIWIWIGTAASVTFHLHRLVTYPTVDAPVWHVDIDLPNVHTTPKWCHIVTPKRCRNVIFASCVCWDWIRSHIHVVYKILCCPNHRCMYDTSIQTSKMTRYFYSTIVYCFYTAATRVFAVAMTYAVLCCTIYACLNDID